MPSRQRPIFLSSFGAHARNLRERAGLPTQPRAALRAKQLGLRTINQQRISLLEKGKTKDPDREFLRELAALYKTNYDALVARLMRDKYGADPASDLTDHAAALSSSQSNPGGADVPASARRELADLREELAAARQRLEESEALVREVQDVTGRLVRVVLGEEVREIKARKAKGRSPHREAS